MRKIIASCAIMVVSFMGVAFAAQPVAAQDNNLLWGNNSYQAVNQIGLGNKDPRAIIASVIKIVLGFLGVLAVIYILLGGFKWMTAGGNEEKAGEARKILAQGVIGLVIILAAFAIATFVINSLLSATTNNGI